MECSACGAACPPAARQCAGCGALLRGTPSVSGTRRWRRRQELGLVLATALVEPPHLPARSARSVALSAMALLVLVAGIGGFSLMHYRAGATASMARHGRHVSTWPRTSSLWSRTGSMHAVRYFSAATLLPNGKVLVAGGGSLTAAGALASAELYNPRTGTWTPTRTMGIPRGEGITATLLHTGKVLVVGGDCCGSAGLYDPRTGRWALTGSLLIPPSTRLAPTGLTAALLHDGKVLVVDSTSNSYTAQVYDPSRGTWTWTGPLHAAGSYSTLTPLPNGKVLATGVSAYALRRSAELYDPRTNTWTRTGRLIVPRYFHTATLLPNGKVLVVGGDCCGSAELYNPNTGNWSLTGSMHSTRFGPLATLLPSGKVLVVGGCCGILGSAELYDPTTGTGPLPTPWPRHPISPAPTPYCCAMGMYSSPTLLLVGATAAASSPAPSYILRALPSLHCKHAERAHGAVRP